MISSIIHALQMYDKRHYMAATFDTFGSLVGVLLTSGLIILLGNNEVGMDEIHFALLVGVIKGAQIYLGAVTIISGLGMLVDTFSPYRYVISSLFVTAAMVFIVVSQKGDVGFNPNMTGMLITLGICTYISGSHLINILFRESKFYAGLCSKQNRRKEDR